MTAADQPPRRNSVEEAELNGGRSVAFRTEILLDGVVQVGVLAYDCDAGTLTREVRDASGQLQLNEARDEFLRETVVGEVTVRWANPLAPTLPASADLWPS